MGRKRIGPGAPASATEANNTLTTYQHTGLQLGSQANLERGMA